MGYILDLRKFVGHRPLIQVGAGIIVEDAEGRVLLQLRADNHCWSYCGGSVEIDERVEDAAKRELLEETGLVAEEVELFGVWSGPELHYVYPNGDEVSNIDIVWLCRSFSGELRPQAGEVEQLRFFRVDEIPEDLSPPIRPALEKWIEQKRSESHERMERDIPAQHQGCEDRACPVGAPCHGLHGHSA